jgi:replication factor C large subunit
MMWVEKYRPSSIESMVGNENVRLELIRWLRKWDEGSKAALLLGPPGTGKTTLARLLAKMKGYNIVELNASDTRTKETLSQKIGEVMKSQSLLGERTLIFLDEVDGLFGRSDYGALEFIKDAVRTSLNPVIMAANDPESEQVRKLSDVCQIFRLKPPPPREIIIYLKEILVLEGYTFDEQKLSEIAVRSGGDMRFAINMLQSGFSETKVRNPTAQEAITVFFISQSEEEAIDALSSYPGQPRDKVRDVFSSVVRSNIKNEEKFGLLRCISEADMILGRINKTGNWRLLRHLDRVLASCISPKARGKSIVYSKESLPWDLLVKVWNKSKKLREIYSSLSPFFWESSHSFVSRDLPYLAFMLEGKDFSERLSKLSGLEEEQVELIKEFIER